ncbi:carbohydrate-responsive element-binding protein [Oncorhynchus kisutch]|uniref:Carbohydrate-responsive element-binding protein-like n=1 Tax=Oncorhynchus kisutch TaxID=8019 RepID=A0A8C7F8H3_ONCKI|nr:carbohydrate-responsive element-binding protein-like [Oncorhynchus kisutch]
MAMAEIMSPELSQGQGQGKQNQLNDLESDSDQEEDHAATTGTGPAVAGSFLRAQVIHSGHFMVSSPHSDCTPRRRKSGATVRYDFDTVNRTWCQTYRFGPLSSGSLSIDPTLTRLFECMSLAYSGKIVSPKWKSFKGLRLLWRDKIRLNNGIWRAWFIQYVEKRKNPVCGFVTPLEGSEADAHRKPEAIVLEGSYWKRRIEVVIKEYHKWRIYYKKRLQKNKDGLLSMLQKGQICRAELEKWSSQMYQEPEVMPEEVHMFDLDCFLSDISDTLFTMTQKPCPWANDRHNTYTSNADMIQPGLTPLQPNLDDFMDIPDIFMSYRGQSLEQVAYADCGYFESSSSGAFPSVSSPVVTVPQLHVDTQLAQSNLSSDSLSQPSSSNSLSGPGYHRQPLTSEMTFNPTNNPKFKGHQQQDYHSEYHTPSMVSGAMPSYGHQAYSGAAVSIATTNIQQQPVSPGDGTFLYPPPCHKYGYHATTASSVTSTVITHTGSTMGGSILGSDPQGHHGYSTTGDMYSPTSCLSQGYSSVVSAPALPSLSVPPHCFSAPQQPGVAGGRRGKHKQKTAVGVQMGSRLSTPQTAPPQTSFLAKLLSSSTQERKPTLGFDATLVATKGHRSTSPNSPHSSSSMRIGGVSGSQLQPGSPWPSGIPLLTPIHCQMSTHSHAGLYTSTSHGSAVSALLTQGSTHPNIPLLIPKTEKLSPVQIYGSEKTSLTVSFSGHSGQMSPTNLLERASNTESPHSLPGHSKMESNKTETRRITHISAEQKRRFNIKLGFDTLHSLVTTLSSQPSIKISKATTLHKTVEYISKMQQERSQLHEEAQRLRDEILLLNSAINVCQQQLPATGVPITRQRFDHMREKFREYVRAQTLQNWKFWIFSIIIEPLFESYNGMVSTASVEDLCRTTLSWLDQHCSLPALRPMVLSSLRLLSTSTSILTDPSLVPEQATQAVTQAKGLPHPHLPGQPQDH